MANQLEKTDKTCNNIYLIDERLCLSDSYNLINFNFDTLSANSLILMEYANQFNELYTYFTKNSSDWYVGAVNTNSKSHLYNGSYTCVNTMSSSWNKKFNLIYPFILEIDDYYSNQSAYLVDIKNWLLLNFPPVQYAINQQVSIYVNLYQIDTFTFSFSGSYEEKCTPMPPPKQVCCSGDQCAELQRGCNITEGSGKNKRHYCINAYSICGKSVNKSCSTAACPSSGSKKLNLLQISNTYNDTYTARCIMFKYSKQTEGDWTFIP